MRVNKRWMIKRECSGEYRYRGFASRGHRWLMKHSKKFRLFVLNLRKEMKVEK